MRISGIARRANGGTVLERATVFSGKQEIAKHEQLDPFELELEDGHRIRVEIAKTLRLEPTETRDVKWKEIEEDPSLSGVAGKNAPGPHVKVRLVRARVLDGARVEVLAADDAEHVFAMAASHRRAPERRVASVVARAVATGDDAKAIVDRMVTPAATAAPRAHKQAKTKERTRFTEKSQRLEIALGVLGAAILALAAVMRLSPLSVDFAMAGFALVGSAAMSWALGRIPRFIRGGKKLGKLSSPEPTFLVLAILSVPLMFIFFGALSDRGTPSQDLHGSVVYNASWTSVFCVGLLGVAFAVMALWRSREEARLFRVLLDAPPLPTEGALDGTWGSFEGIVRDPTPTTIEGEAVAIVHVISEEIVEGSDPNIYTERVLSQGTFFLDADDRSVEVHPDDALWASSVGIKVRNKKGRKKTIIEHVSAVPLRGTVLLAGRAVRAEDEKIARVKATGPESLVFVAVRQGESARRECREMLGLRRVGFLIGVGLLGVAVAAVVLAEPQLPKFNVPASD